MDQGNWNPGTSWNLDDPDIAALLDDKTAARVAGRVHNQLPGGIPRSSNPVLKTSQNAYTNKHAPRRQSAGGKAPTKPGDQDLMTQMIGKLRALERENQELKRSAVDREGTIRKLESENQRLRLSANTEYVEAFAGLEEENKSLKAQVDEMTGFLKGYGLNWVGGQKQGALNTEAIFQELNAKSPLYNYKLPDQINVNDIRRKALELNMQLEPTNVQQNGGVFKFKEAETLAIFLFQNGLILKGRPFRPYHSNEAQSILSDLLDGYFPFELRKKFPEGVALNVIDKSDEVFQNSDSQFRSVNDPSTGLLSAAEYLQQLPESVIRGGEIIHVREEVGKILKSKPVQQTGTIEIRTHVDEFLESSQATEADNSRVTTLRLKTENGKKNLIVKMWFGDEFRRILEYIEPHREGRGRFEIKSTFPAMTFSLDETRTFEALDLVPNYSLAIRQIQQQ